MGIQQQRHISVFQTSTPVSVWSRHLLKRPTVQRYSTVNWGTTIHFKENLVLYNVEGGGGGDNQCSSNNWKWKKNIFVFSRTKVKYFISHFKLKSCLSPLALCRSKNSLRPITSEEIICFFISTRLLPGRNVIPSFHLLCRSVNMSNIPFSFI